MKQDDAEMSSLVIELQHDALNRSVPVSDLLRKALVVARKLSLSDSQDWIEKELGRYDNSDEIPSYREVSGQLRAWNPYRGWIPVICKNTWKAEMLSKRKTSQPIAEIEKLLQDKPTDSPLQIPLPHDIQRDLCKNMPLETEITLFVQETALVRIIDAARTIILKWALKLEEDGILGEGLSFSEKEKQQADAHSYNITNFFGPVQSSQFQQGSVRSAQVSARFDFDVDTLRLLLEKIRGELVNLSLSADSRAEAEAEVETVDVQLRSPKPKQSIIGEGLQSLRAILEGAGGGTAAHLVIELGNFLL